MGSEGNTKEILIKAFVTLVGEKKSDRYNGKSVNSKHFCIFVHLFLSGYQLDENCCCNNNNNDYPEFIPPSVQFHIPNVGFRTAE